MKRDEKEKRFRLIVMEMQSPLVRYTRKITGELESAREVVQDSFLKLWNQSEKKIWDAARPWLYRVSRNGALDLKRRQRGMDPFDDEKLFLVEGSPEDQMQKKEIFMQIGRLKAQHREVLLLKFQEGMSYQEIAEVTGHSSSHVGVLIHEAMKDLKTSVLSKEEVK